MEQEAIEVLVGQCSSQDMSFITQEGWRGLIQWWHSMGTLPWAEIGTYGAWVLYCEIPEMALRAMGG